MKYSLIFSLFLFAETSWSCEIKTYDRILKINKVLDDKIIASSKDCDEQTEQVFIDLISNSNGVVNDILLERLFLSEYQKSVNIVPSKISIQSLSDFIEENLKHKGFHISRVSALHGSSSLNLTKNDQVTLECSTCQNSGRKNIKMIINNQNLWVNADLLHKIKALKLKENLSYHTPVLTSDDFEAVEVLEKQPNKFFTDLENIKFYKVVRPLKTGDLLKVHDLSPKSLITFGQKINMIIKNQSINLKTVGIAQKGGKFGDYIEIKNPKTKKTVMGKIIDFNTAVIDI